MANTSTSPGTELSDASPARFGAWVALILLSIVALALEPGHSFSLAVIPLGIANLIAAPAGTLQRRATRSQWLALLGVVAVLLGLLVASAFLPPFQFWAHQPRWLPLLARWLFVAGLFAILGVQAKRFLIRRRDSAA